MIELKLKDAKISYEIKSKQLRQSKWWDKKFTKQS